MARRHAGKSNPRAAPARGQVRREKAKAAAPDGTLKERVAALERERDALREALEQERTRGRRLEQLHAAARDRVAWALDSLQNILGGKD